MPAVLRVVGPPGSGKTLLIVSLVDALRQRGHRVASVVRREAIEAADIDPRAPRQLDAGVSATVVVLASGGRVTLEQMMELPALRDLVASLDPMVDLLLAEGFDDAGYPAVALVPADGPAPAVAGEDLLAVVSSEEMRGTFAVFGPGETNGLADLVAERLLDARPEVSMQITVDGRPVDAMGFVTDMIAKPVLTMIEQLKGVGIPRSVRLHIRRRSKHGEGDEGGASDS